jgi:N6-L-threonylcarbamoyladenine synthase
MYLAIESSCDETSIAILDKQKKPVPEDFLVKIQEIKILSSVISSQIEVHKQYGGVIPEIGAREHAKNIYTVFDETLKKGGITKQFFLENLEGVFVTSEPGLFSALQVGLEFAKIIKFWVREKTQKEIQISHINHLHGHISSCFYNPELTPLENNTFPHLHLLVSGGNTQLILLSSWSEKSILGQTLDDAAGECLDKVGRMLGFPYPGGVWVAKIAKETRENWLNLPIGMQKSKNLDFSYSGLKTSVRYLVQSQKFENWVFEQKLSQSELDILLNMGGSKEPSSTTSNHLEFIYKVCVSTQFVVVAQLINVIKKSLKEINPRSIGISGGVSANLLLRSNIQELFSNKAEIFLPPKNLTGDNAVMIGIAGLLNIS